MSLMIHDITCHSCHMTSTGKPIKRIFMNTYSCTTITRYQEPGTRFQVPGTECQVLSTRYPHLNTNSTTYCPVNPLAPYTTKSYLAAGFYPASNHPALSASPASPAPLIPLTWTSCPLSVDWSPNLRGSCLDCYRSYAHAQYCH